MQDDAVSPSNLTFYDAHPKLESARESMLNGLKQQPKRLSPMWFYDERGSQLFEQIMALPEYYPTRTELAILTEAKTEISALCGQHCVLIEPGSGNCEKVRLLLDALKPKVYVPLDISADFLFNAAQNIAQDYPWLQVQAICADFNRGWPFFDQLPGGKRVVFYPGSTLGNLEPNEALTFLTGIRQLVGDDGGMLIGVDLHKSSSKLNAAYNDSQGVTAEFNLNILNRVNHVLDIDLPIENFAHEAFYNEKEQRIEMHLISRDAVARNVDDIRLQFDPGERIHTENSYKYSIESFQDLAQRAGFDLAQTWLDADNLFSVHYLSASMARS